MTRPHWFRTVTCVADGCVSSVDSFVKGSAVPRLTERMCEYSTLTRTWPASRLWLATVRRRDLAGFRFVRPGCAEVLESEPKPAFELVPEPEPEPEPRPEPEPQLAQPFPAAEDAEAAGG